MLQVHLFKSGEKAAQYAVDSPDDAFKLLELLELEAFLNSSLGV
jgi:hypothetical protein